MAEHDKTAREMARIVWEKYGTEIEAIKADTTHLKNVQGQHGIALANLQDQVTRVQSVQEQHGEALAELKGNVAGLKNILVLIASNMGIEIPDWEGDTSRQSEE